MNIQAQTAWGSQGVGLRIWVAVGLARFGRGGGFQPTGCQTIHCESWGYGLESEVHKMAAENTMRMLTRLLVAGILLSGLVWAQEQDDSNGAGEANHGVARVSLMNGDVSVQRGDSGDTVAAVVNAPLVASDHILTGPAARAEIQFDQGNFVRLG